MSDSAPPPDATDASPLADAGGDATTLPIPSSDAADDGASVDAGVDASSPDSASSDASTPPVDGGTDSSATALKPAQGEVLITEVMFDPTTAEPDTEWLEIYNAASEPRLLSGLTLADSGGHTHTIGASPPVVVAPGAYVVLARSKSAAITSAQVPAAAIAYEYALIALANSGGSIALVDGATTIAQSPFGSFALSSAGSSVQLKTLSYGAESTKSAWCASTVAWATGSDLGTPGAAQKCQ